MGDYEKERYVLRGKKERISEDWMWRERRMRYKLEEIMRKEGCGKGGKREGGNV